MTSPSLQASVAERIKALYAISRELEQLFPGRHYTPDGHMVGSIGEALAASWYGLELFTAGAETHDAKAPDGRLVQIKATKIDRVALSSEPEWLLVMKIHHDGIFIEEYNGSGALAWEQCGKTVSGLSRWRRYASCRRKSRWISGCRNLFERSRTAHREVRPSKRIYPIKRKMAGILKMRIPACFLFFDDLQSGQRIGDEHLHKPIAGTACPGCYVLQLRQHGVGQPYRYRRALPCL